jgi:hypothetical protein
MNDTPSAVFGGFMFILLAANGVRAFHHYLWPSVHDAISAVINYLLFVPW